MLRNLFTVAVDDGKTVVVPMTLPGLSTAVGAWLEAAVTEPSSAQRTAELLPSMLIGRKVKVGVNEMARLAPRLVATQVVLIETKVHFRTRECTHYYRPNLPGFRRMYRFPR